MLKSELPTTEELARAEEWAKNYTAPDPSLTKMILNGFFGEASRRYAIYKKAKEYAMLRNYKKT